MKRRVQAQRKFAQGVHIPSLNLDRRTDISPVKDANDEKRPVKNIIIKNTSPSNLLDIVSLRNLHKHDHQPIVLIEKCDINSTKNYSSLEAIKDEGEFKNTRKGTVPSKAVISATQKNISVLNNEIKKRILKYKRSYNELKRSLLNNASRHNLRNKRMSLSQTSNENAIKDDTTLKVTKKRILRNRSMSIVVSYNETVVEEKTPKVTNERSVSVSEPYKKNVVEENIQNVTNTRKLRNRSLSVSVPYNENAGEENTIKVANKQSLNNNKTLRKRSMSLSSPYKKDVNTEIIPKIINNRSLRNRSKSTLQDIKTEQSQPKNGIKKHRKRSMSIADESIKKINKKKKSCNSPNLSEFSSDDETPLRNYNSKKSLQAVKFKPEIKKFRQLRSAGKLSHEFSDKNNRKQKKHVIKVNPCSVINTKKQKLVEKENDKCIPIINTIESSTLNDSFYGASEIERWLNNLSPTCSNVDIPQSSVKSIQDNSKPKEITYNTRLQNSKKVTPDEGSNYKKNTDVASNHFKKPSLPHLKKMPKRENLCKDAINVEKIKYNEDLKKKANKLLKNNLPCPSSILDTSLINDKTMQNIQSANLQNRCNSCYHCSKLTKVINIAMKSLQEKEKDEIGPCPLNTCEDIYDFNNEIGPQKSDSATFSDFRQKKKTQEIKTGELTAMGEVPFMYLDVLPKNVDYLIEVVTVKGHQGKPIMKARLHPKSDDKIKNKQDEMVTFSDGENILSKLLKDLGTHNGPTISPMNSLSEEMPDLHLSLATSSEGSTKNEPIRKFPEPNEKGQLVIAPTFYPSKEEFKNPLQYIEKIKSSASSFGLCKIVPPPDFKPPCFVEDEIRFNAVNQYPSKMYMRWGPASKELIAIKTLLATQNVYFKRPPVLNGIEVNLPKLFKIVQKLGGLKEVIVQKKWLKVAEEMNFQKFANIEAKLDKVYVKYLLPYDTLTNSERQTLLDAVEKKWKLHYKKMIIRAANPLHRQKRLMGESSSEDDDDDTDDLEDVDDCVVSGRAMNLGMFKKVAAKSMNIYFPKKAELEPAQVEEMYWRLVLLGNDLICVNTASIDTGDQGYGFPNKTKNDPYSKHPWNLKVLSNSPDSVLSSLGPVLSVTVPTLHLGMVFTTSCLHRDPHGLPWIEYLHSGASKIWYGIPDEQSSNFRRAVEKLQPAFCQNKPIWLSSDITMIPPYVLKEEQVSLSKVIQEPGEFIVIFPKAYSCSICTGYTVSECVYFGPNGCIQNVTNAFQEVRESCEPTMFSLEQLLIALACDSYVPLSVLLEVHTTLISIIHNETSNRNALREFRISVKNQKTKKTKTQTWNVREQAECDICRSTLYLSKVSGLIGKYSDLCLLHALRLLELKNEKRSPSETLTQNEAILECFYSVEELDAILTRLCKRMSIGKSA